MTDKDTYTIEIKGDTKELLDWYREESHEDISYDQAVYRIAEDCQYTDYVFGEADFKHIVHLDEDVYGKLQQSKRSFEETDSEALERQL